MITAERTEMERLEELLREHFRLDQRIEAIKNRKLYSLEIELTRRCNLECIYCYNSSSRNPGLPDFDFDLLKRILRDAYIYGIRSITYLGGEPTLHPKINEIIKFTKDIGMEEVCLYTNGTIMNERLLDSINEYVDSVVLHMDTVRRDTFADLHNIEERSSFKYFDAILNNLQVLMLSGYHSKKLRHCLTLFRPTYAPLQQTLQWAIKDIGMLTSIFIPVVAVGRGTQILSNDLLGVEEIKSCYEIRAKIEQRPELLLLGPSEYCKQYQMSMCYLNCDLAVFPYAGLDIACGNVKTEALPEIIQKNYHLLSFANWLNELNNEELIGNCHACVNGTFCCGTRTASYSLFSQVNYSDPRCWIEA